MPAVRPANPKGGRPKEPIETRKTRSKRPHHARKGPPDVPMTQVFDLDKIPVDPPFECNADERCCWDMITEQQRGAMGARWIYRSDCAFIMATCRNYGRWMEVRRELNEWRESNGGFVDSETGQVTPLLDKELRLNQAYQKSLIPLGLVPNRRQVTMEDVEPEAESLIAH